MLYWRLRRPAIPAARYVFGGGVKYRFSPAARPSRFESGWRVVLNKEGHQVSQIISNDVEQRRAACRRLHPVPGVVHRGTAPSAARGKECNSGGNDGYSRSRWSYRSACAITFINATPLKRFTLCTATYLVRFSRPISVIFELMDGMNLGYNDEVLVSCGLIPFSAGIPPRPVLSGARKHPAGQMPIAFRSRFTNRITCVRQIFEFHLSLSEFVPCRCHLRKCRLFARHFQKAQGSASFRSAMPHPARFRFHSRICFCAHGMAGSSGVQYRTTVGGITSLAPPADCHRSLIGAVMSAHFPPGAAQ